MNAQEIFETVSKHLITQGRQAYDEVEGTCAYVMKADKKILTCAIGCLIPRERYISDIEGSDVFGVLDYYPQVLKGIVPKSERTLASTLQSVHDGSEGELYDLFSDQPNPSSAATKAVDAALNRDKRTFKRKGLKALLERVGKHYKLDTSFLATI